MQSAPEQWALDRPTVSKHDAILLWRFFTFCDLDLWRFHRKIGTPLTRALGNFYANFDFSTFFVFELGANTGKTDGQTDRRTDKMRNAAYRKAA